MTAVPVQLPTSPVEAVRYLHKLTLLQEMQTAYAQGPTRSEWAGTPLETLLTLD